MRDHEQRADTAADRRNYFRIDDTVRLSLRRIQRIIFAARGNHRSRRGSSALRFPMRLSTHASSRRR